MADKKTMKVPICQINAKLMAAKLASEGGSASGAERRKRMVLYTGASVVRYQWEDPGYFMLTLDMNPESIRMERLKSGKLPIIDSHNSYTVRDQLGRVEDGWLENGQLVGDCLFSNREDVTPVWQDVDDGIIRNCSVGISIYRLVDETGEDEKIKKLRATDWEPLELSLCSVPADPGAGFNEGVQVRFSEAEIVSASELNRALQAQKGQNMDPVTTNAGDGARANNQTPALTAADEARLRAEGQEAEQRRVSEIESIGTSLRLSGEFVKSHTTKKTTVEEFRRLAINEAANIAAQQPAQRGPVVMITGDARDNMRAGMVIALMHRADPKKYKMEEAGRNYANLSLLEIAKDCLDANGIRHRGLDKMMVAKLAFESTSDFPYILENVLNKNLRSGYEIADALSHWKDISARRTAPDFKAMSELQLDSETRMEKVGESGEIRYGYLVEGKESWKLATYAQIVAITRQVIVNDDLGAFTRIPMLLGQEVSVLEATTMWALITGNVALADTYGIFHANHKNVDSAAVISIESIGTGISLMMKQTTPGGKYLNVAPKFLVVPAEMITLARQYTSSAYVPYEQAKINPWNGSLTPIAEARLGVADDDAWYMFADPELAPVVVHAYLEGQEGPYTETKQGFEIDGVQVRIRHDFAGAAIDYRGAVKNPGSD